MITVNKSYKSAHKLQYNYNSRVQIKHIKVGQVETHLR